MEILKENLKEIIKINKKGGVISKAVSHENRLKFHIETEVTNNSYERVVNEFLEWVKTLLPSDKYRTFLNLFKFPLYTNEITEKIFNQLERVFDSKNPFFSYEFTKPELKLDWEEYRRKELNEKMVWRVKGWEAYKVSINSVLVVDLPTESSDERLEPYFYWLDIKNVIDYDLKDDNETFEYIKFHYDKDENLIALFCDKYYRVIRLKNGEYQDVIIEEEHGLGYVPAKFFWTTPLRKSVPDLKRSDLSNQLSVLDTLLFKYVSKQHLDLYASYPIYSAYSSDCDYEMNHEKDGEIDYTDVCDNGYIRRDGNYVMYGNGLMKCPRCSEHHLAGPGSFIEVRPPSEENNFKDMRDPVSIKTIDRESLDYNVDEIKRIEEKLTISVVGGGGEPKNEQAKNEKQINAGFEEKTTVLRNIAWNFERARKFVNDTICELRYREAFIGSSISLGKDWYIYTSDDLRIKYDNAKKGSLGMYELESIQEQILSTEYKNNPDELNRVNILKDLEPYRHLTLTEIIELKDKGIIQDDELLQIKINFSNFIDRFERENMDIVAFGILDEYDNKIKTITNILKSYGNTGNTGNQGEQSSTSKKKGEINI